MLRQRGSLAWYAAAGLVAVAHLTYIPAVAWRIEAMTKGDLPEEKRKVKTSNVELQKGWLKVNLVRMMTTDLGAWICAWVAVIKTFS